VAYVPADSLRCDCYRGRAQIDEQAELRRRSYVEAGIAGFAAGFRAAVLRAAGFRAAVLRAVVLRAVVLLALALAAVLRAGALRAVVLRTVLVAALLAVLRAAGFAAVLRAVVLRAVVLRAVVLRAVVIAIVESPKRLIANIEGRTIASPTTERDTHGADLVPQYQLKTFFGNRRLIDLLTRRGERILSNRV
jgi:hypothetical protein